MLLSKSRALTVSVRLARSQSCEAAGHALNCTRLSALGHTAAEYISALAVSLVSPAKKRQRNERCELIWCAAQFVGNITAHDGLNHGHAATGTRPIHIRPSATPHPSNTAGSRPCAQKNWIPSDTCTSHTCCGGWWVQQPSTAAACVSMKFHFPPQLPQELYEGCDEPRRCANANSDEV